MYVAKLSKQELEIFMLAITVLSEDAPYAKHSQLLLLSCS